VNEKQKRRNRTRRRREHYERWANSPDNPLSSGSSSDSGGFRYYATAPGADLSDPNSMRPSVTTQNFPVPLGPNYPESQPSSSRVSSVQPLPTGRSLTTIPGNSPELTARKERLEDVFENPTQFVNENVVELNADQSLIDRGLGFLESLFNYEDEADLQIFGINLSAVESVWDRFNRHYTGVANLRDIGIGALISAMPGGVRTLEFGELSGGASLLEVLNGEIGMKPNVAPSPMQIAITSVGIEAKRIRDGDGRLSDLLLANPVTGPFVAAALAAETSPVQKTGFNLMDPEQRAEAFGDGWERFFSGFGDFGVQMADPLIAATVAGKIAHNGLLGIGNMGRKGSQVMDAYVPVSIDDILKHTDDATDGVAATTYAERTTGIVTRGMDAPAPTKAQVNEARRVDKVRGYAAQYGVDELPDNSTAFWKDMEDKGLIEGGTAEVAQKAYIAARKVKVESSQIALDADKTGSLAKQIAFADRMAANFQKWQRTKIENAAKAAGDRVPPELRPNTRLSVDLREKGVTNPLTLFIADVVRFDPLTGLKALTAQQIARHVAIAKNPRAQQIGRLLHEIDDPYIAGVVIQTLHGSESAKKILSDLRPAIADELSRARYSMAMNKALMNPQKYAAALQTLKESSTSLAARISSAEKVEADRMSGLRSAWEVGMDRAVAADPTVKRVPFDETQHIDQNSPLARLLQEQDELDALIRYMDEGVPPDPAQIGDFYVEGYLDRIMDDLYQNSDTLEWMDNIRTSMGGDGNYQLIVKDNYYARMVAASRNRRARAAYEYSVEGAGLIRKKRIVQVDQTTGKIDRARDPGWVSSSQFGTGRFRRAMRFWRWFGEETPAGYVGFKGTSRVGSEREIRAQVNSLDMYSGDPIRVIPATGEPFLVGGRAAGEEIVDRWNKALLDPNADLKSVIVDIERTISDDMQRAYGIDANEWNKKMSRADAYRAKAISEATRNGRIVDNETIEMVPYLMTHLANGHQMHNWDELETLVQRAIINNDTISNSSTSRKFTKAGQITADRMKAVDQAFQEFWRPTVLFRLGYTQRNIFEGITRSMVYYSSLAPLAWPVVGTYHGVSNVVKKAVMSKVEKRVRANIEPEGYTAARKSLTDAEDAYYQVAGAYLWTPDEESWRALRSREVERGRLDMAEEPPTDARYYIYDRDVDGNDYILKVMDEDQFKAEKAAKYQKMLEARQDLEPLKTAFDGMVGDKSKFGKWRKKERGLVECQIGNLRGQYNLLVSELANGAVNSAQVAATFVTLQRAERVALYRARTLDYDPMGSLRMWKETAGQERRIGSGSSNTAVGRMNDAFGDEFAAMNYGTMSSDTARRMTFSTTSDQSESLFMSQVMLDPVTVKYDHLRPEAWIDGMAHTLEKNAWNPLVQVLVRNDLDPDKALGWLLDTPDGREFAREMMWLQGSDFVDYAEYTPAVQIAGVPVPQAASFVKRKKWATDGKEVTEYRLAKMADRERNPLTGRWQIREREGMSESYLRTVAADLRDQLQDQPVFMALLKRRVMSLEEGSSAVIASDDVRNAMAMLSYEDRQKLRNVQGSVAIETGTSGFREAWRKFVSKAFTAIGTIPEDALVRGPFYNRRFKEVRNDLVLRWLDGQEGGLPAGVKPGSLSKSGKVIDGDLTHPAFQIPADQLRDILVEAHEAALWATREYLYTIERRTKLGKYGEYLWPFISATQNTLQAGGQLLYRAPWTAPIAYNLWASPQRLGFRDEEGNLTMPMPMRWVKDILEDAEDIPIFGGIMSGKDMISIPMNGLNVWAPDTGFFGVIPRPNALVQMSASNLMAWGFMTVETPDALKAVMGEEAAAETWSLLKDYIFGEEGSMSTRPGSVDMLLPAWARWLWNSKDDTSGAYTFHYSMEMAAQEARWKAGERKQPTPAEIHKRVTNKMLFYSWGAFGAPSPLTPYPILTRPNIEKPTVQTLREILSMYLEAQGKKIGVNEDGSTKFAIEPGDAYRAFERDFGEDILSMAISSGSKNIGGADATEATVSDIKAYDTFIRENNELLEGDYQILDILVNNGNGAALDFSDEAQRWQQITRIPGATETWRAPVAPEEGQTIIDTNVGWVSFQNFMDGMDADMQQMGLRNMQQAGAARLRDAKAVFIKNMAESNPAWYYDYSDGARERTPKVVGLLTRMVADPRVQRRMFDNGQETLYGAMSEYVYYRQQAAMALEAAGSDMEKEQIKEMWAGIRQDLKNGNVRWAEIQNRWLDGDEDPGWVGEDMARVPELAGVGSDG